MASHANNRLRSLKRVVAVCVSLLVMWFLNDPASVYSLSSLQKVDDEVSQGFSTAEEQTLLRLDQENEILGEVLLNGLQDPKRDIRYAAVRLFHYGQTTHPKKAAEILLGMLPDEDMWVTGEILRVLSQLARERESQGIVPRILMQLLKYAEDEIPIIERQRSRPSGLGGRRILKQKKPW